MKRAWWLGLFLLASAAAVSFAGDVQIACGAGLRVYLDGKFVGTSNSTDDGLFLAGVPDGRHSIRVERDGFEPQLFRVEVGTLPIEVRVPDLSLVPPTRPDREGSSDEIKQPTGTLVVMSAPQNCVVEIQDKREVKSTPLLWITGLAPGVHPISFTKPGYDRVSGAVTIQSGAETTVRGDLKAGKVETIYEGSGSLRVISTPEYCTVQFLGKTTEKTRTMLNLTHIPAGEHRFVVEWKGRKLARNLMITAGHRTVVVVNFAKGEEPFVVSFEPE